MTARDYRESKDTKSKTWALDEKGRRYHEENGVRDYATREERDSALDETYRLSAAVRILAGAPEGPARNIPALVCENAQALAELFWREAPTTPGNETRTKFAQWCEKNFGRELEKVAREVFWGEVRARMVGATTRTLALFESFAEQQRYERAAAELPPYKGEDALERCEEIVRRATGKRVDETVMPRPMSRKAWERRAAEEARKAREYKPPSSEQVEQPVGEVS